MTNKIKTAFFLLALVILPSGVTAERLSPTDRYIAMALQGNLAAAGSLFEVSKVNASPAHEAELADRFESRFITRDENLSPGTGDVFADTVVLIYRDYWVRTLTGELGFEEGESFLQRSLLDLLEQMPEPGVPDSASDAFARIGAVLQDKGFYYLDTPAPPLRDLFLWTGEENTRFTVRLTDRTQAVQVTFITGILSLGWKEFATLGLVSTTGWVEGTRLYCIKEAYDRYTENFRISYLKHESRHLADFERFPGLPSAELEYRAKLTELAFASTSLQALLDDFTLKSSPGADSPHTLANYRVTRDMYRAMHGAPLPASGDPWKNVEISTVNRTARALLQQNTELLESGSQ